MQGGLAAAVEGRLGAVEAAAQLVLGGDELADAGGGVVDTKNETGPVEAHAAALVEVVEAKGADPAAVQAA